MAPMQASLIMFDHIRKSFAIIPTGPLAGRKLAEVMALQRKQVATSGRSGS